MGDTVFLIVGIIFAALGALTLISVISAAVKCKEHVRADICDVKVSERFWKGRRIREYRPIVKFEFGGKEYEVKTDFSSQKKEKYDKGNLLDIWVNPKNPNEIRTGLELSPIVFGIIGLAIGITLIVCYFL